MQQMLVGLGRGSEILEDRTAELIFCSLNNPVASSFKIQF